MIPLIPSLALSMLSFLSSAFVFLHEVVPLIPKSRVHSIKQGHRNAVVLSRSAKVHLWLSGIDALSVALFIWEVFDENLANHLDFSIATSPASSIRLQIVLAIRQICLFSISAASLIQVRKAKAPSFGPFQILLWAPVLVMTVVATAFTGIMANAGVGSFRIGTAAYLSVIASLSTLGILYLMSDSNINRRKVVSYSEMSASWQDATAEAKSHHSFANVDVDALRDGSSWITSNSGSCQNSLSSFSFESSAQGIENARTENEPREIAICSQRIDSWLPEPSNPPSTMTDWSFSVNRSSNIASLNTTLKAHSGLHGSQTRSLPVPPPSSRVSFMTFSDSDRFGNRDMEKVMSTSRAVRVDVPWSRLIGWLAFIWLSLIFAFPYLFSDSPRGPMLVLFILSVTIPAPVLAFTVMYSPFPAPLGVVVDLTNLPSPSEPKAQPRSSGSITVVEGRRSGDVWLTRGDATDGKGRLSRATSLLYRVPKLSVLPVKSTTPQKAATHDPAHRDLQHNSFATSAFVAIDCRINDMGWLPCSDGSEGSHTIPINNGFPDARNPITRSCSSMVSQPKRSRRRSSTSSRSSGGTASSRRHRGAFTTNLETILDVSMNDSPSHKAPEDRKRIPVPVCLRDANVVYDSDYDARGLQQSRNDCYDSGLGLLPPTRAVRPATKKSGATVRNAQK